MRQKYYSEASGLLFLLDAADEQRLEEACSAFRTFRELHHFLVSLLA